MNNTLVVGIVIGIAALLGVIFAFVDIPAAFRTLMGMFAAPAAPAGPGIAAGLYSYMTPFGIGSLVVALLFIAIIPIYFLVDPSVTVLGTGFGIAGGFVLAGLLIYVLKNFQGADYPSFQYASIIAMYLPVSYVLVGIFTDIVTQRLNESVSSIAAITAVLINSALNTFVTRNGYLTSVKLQETISQNGNIGDLYRRVFEGCTVPGFESLESIFAPQSFVIIWTLFFYFLTVMKQENKGQSISGLLGLTTSALLVQGMFISSNKCLKPEYYAGGSLVTPLLFPIVLGGIVGSLFGWQAPAIIKAIGQIPSPSCAPGTANYGGICCPPAQHNSNGTCVDHCPAGTISVGHICLTPDEVQSGRGGGLGSVLPPVGDPTSGSSSSDDNQFVCEAYKNGELITSTIAE